LSQAYQKAEKQKPSLDISKAFDKVNNGIVTLDEVSRKHHFPRLLGQSIKSWVSDHCIAIKFDSITADETHVTYAFFRVLLSRYLCFKPISMIFLFRTTTPASS
jgi:hypothetical protein